MDAAARGTGGAAVTALALILLAGALLCWLAVSLGTIDAEGE